ncbi:hypothetical protein AGABI1DRAFT_110839 [Agaricus bisporus var. burnettii JB137-S8]|uniref:Fungal lipase-type domain-containing protein n=1 Tax=Agaricus bisporus var. burnettii (strain JB137-S8 / ATCC MYA-4627 / FGSC 10392) TaxID=597362 RepID=K5WBK4_AGABU|nr:uncharacterized protein AGABI1DRAFT_110839 [Agaricus bisporus var. burnettii JB137-S8]EKM84289.1 hypothetical protein AGABI1DRAFT_110839 [Agaricus bisporus var. burnettii JB137-S8]
MLAPTLLAVASTIIASVGANPLKLKRQSITALSSEQIDFYTPYTRFAGAAFCESTTLTSWTCGANCEANSDFIPTAAGGDGDGVQFWYVGYSPSQSSVIVGHQGTNVSNFMAVATDLRVFQMNLDANFFPGISSSIEVHFGFSTQHAVTAESILSAVQTTIRDHNATLVTVVGHSLGCALALLDGVYLPLHIPDVTFRTIGYGCPRVGNQAFADYVDANVNFTRINNREDIIPIVPGRFLDYVHPSGEIHISEENDDAWLACPGQDNESDECIVGAVSNIFFGDEDDHAGPYNGIYLGACNADGAPVEEN